MATPLRRKHFGGKPPGSNPVRVFLRLGDHPCQERGGCQLAEFKVPVPEQLFNNLTSTIPT
jgi:hypothetical protein